MKTLVQAAISSVIGLVVFGLLVFVPAGTFDYWRGWAFIAVFAAATLIPSIYLAVKNPEALRRRMQAGPGAESRPLQKVIIAVAFVSMGGHDRDQRVGLSLRLVDGARSRLGDRTCARRGRPHHRDAGDDPERLCRSQCHRRIGPAAVVDGVVRVRPAPDVLRECHPDDRCPAGARLVLGSAHRRSPALRCWPSASTTKRRLLTQELAGYREYMQKVHYRLVPYVW